MPIFLAAYIGVRRHQTESLPGWLRDIAQREIPFYDGKHSLTTVVDAIRLHEVDKEHDVLAAKFCVVFQLLKEVYQHFGMPALIINVLLATR